MTTISIIASCHSANMIDRLISSLLNQTFNNYEIVIAYDKNELDNKILLPLCANNEAVKLIPCTPISGKYEPFMTDNEMYLQAIKMLNSDYVIFCSEIVNYPETFIEKAFNKISTEESDICITPMAISWTNKITTVYDSQIDKTRYDYYSDTRELNSLYLHASSCWWLHSPANKIIKREFFNKCIDKLTKFYSRNNAHLDLDSIILFSTILSNTPKISYENSIYSELTWKDQDELISKYFDNINNKAFIREAAKVISYINKDMHSLLKINESDIQTYNHTLISRIIWRYEWKFSKIRQQFEDFYNTKFEKFSLDYIGSYGKQITHKGISSNNSFSQLTTTFNTTKKDNDLAVYVSMHKLSYIPKNNKYIIPIQVGTALSNERYSKIIHDDDTPDNISRKNKMYCEMTAQYYVWKNIKDKD